jgi:2-dehydropantoate 2-reductase
MAATFVIVGAGAIGCHVGGRLAAAGETVVFVARPAHATSLRRLGLVVSDLDGFHAALAPDRFTVVETLPEAAAIAGDAAFVLLCTKGGATGEAAAGIGQAFPARTPVLSLQNGVDNVARIRTAAPALHALAGMVPFNVVLTAGADGRLTAHRATSGVLHGEDDAALRAVSPAFARAGLPLVFEADMASIQWGKLLLNLNNPVNALSDLPLRDELLDADYRRVLASLQAEAMAVMRKAGIAPGKVGAAPPALIPFILRLPTWAFSRIAASMLKIDRAARSSMWDDVQAGRETEIDDLCGAVMRLAQANGLDAPKNAAMRALIKGHRKGERVGGAELRRRIEAA